MTVPEAQHMLVKADFKSTPQVWLDLGCGAGTFTIALAELLPSGSQVICVDKNSHDLPAQSPNGNAILFIQQDFIRPIQFDLKIDGVLMANSLHYVVDPKSLVDYYVNEMMLETNFILIEYDTKESNPWIPFPVPFQNLEDLFGENILIRKLTERKSIYGESKLYVSQIRTKNYV